MQVENQRQQKHGSCLVPKRILALRSLWRCVLKQVCYQALNIIVVTQINEGVITVALRHVDKVDYADIITFLLQQVSGVSQQLAFGVQAHERRVRVHNVGLGKETGFTGTGAAAGQDIQISAVLSAVQSNGDILRQNFILRCALICVLLVNLACHAPFGRAVLLASSIVPFGGEIDSNHNTVD